jgi:hypothetical protein
MDIRRRKKNLVMQTKKEDTFKIKKQLFEFLRIVEIRYQYDEIFFNDYVPQSKENEPLYDMAHYKDNLFSPLIKKWEKELDEVIIVANKDIIFDNLINELFDIQSSVKKCISQAGEELKKENIPEGKFAELEKFAEIHLECIEESKELLRNKFNIHYITNPEIPIWEFNLNAIQVLTLFAYLCDSNRIETDISTNKMVKFIENYFRYKNAKGDYMPMKNVMSEISKIRREGKYRTAVEDLMDMLKNDKIDKFE